MSRVYSRIEAASYLKIGVTTLWRLTRSGELPVVQVGARRVYREVDLDSFLQQKLSSRK